VTIVLDPVPKWHHVVVAVAVVVTPVLVALGLAGSGIHPERFDAKQVLVTPEGNEGVRIREVVDQDFGNEQRHGYERTIPNNFGAPVDVRASSPDAPADLSVEDLGTDTRIRLGDPNTTITGQRRYELAYTLPAAQLSSGALALNIISPGEELETGRFEVVLSGFDLQDPTCNAGTFGAVGGCTLERDGDVYRAVIEPLPVGAGITVGGAIVGLSSPADVPVPAIPSRRASHHLPLAGAALALGLLAAAGGFLTTRRLGRNEVGGGSAADAAYAVANDGPVRLVTDRQLEAMATTEFEPPRGLRPWHGALLLEERVSTSTVSAWFSDQIAQGVIELRNDGKELVAGPHLAEAPPITKSRIETLLNGSELTLGTYEPRLTTLWKQVTEEQKVAARESGWWKRGAPGSPRSIPSVLVSVMLVLGVILGIAFWGGLRQSVPITLAVAFVGPAVIAGWAYWSLLPSRSASGSAAALRAESFRRFLEASEGKHVDWAWQHGLLRDYSAWAVALGAAAAWGRAIASSAVPPLEITANTMPLLMYSHAMDFHSTITPPQSSGSSGGFSGGGFSGGFSGGGGGGGSSGSW
jgi:uncharacterized membrane protein YgcG